MSSCYLKFCLDHLLYILCRQVYGQAILNSIIMSILPKMLSKRIQNSQSLFVDSLVVSNLDISIPGEKSHNPLEVSVGAEALGTSHHPRIPQKTVYRAGQLQCAGELVPAFYNRGASYAGNSGEFARDQRPALKCSCIFYCN